MLNPLLASPRSTTQVSALSNEDAEHRELFRRNVSATHMLGVSRASGMGEWCQSIDCLWGPGLLGLGPPCPCSKAAAYTELCTLLPSLNHVHMQTRLSPHLRPSACTGPTSPFTGSPLTRLMVGGCCRCCGPIVTALAEDPRPRPGSAVFPSSCIVAHSWMPGCGKFTYCDQCPITSAAQQLH